MHTFVLYETNLNYIGKTRAENSEDAFKLMIAHYFKHELQNHEFLVEEINNNSFVVKTNFNNFLLKRKE